MHQTIHALNVPSFESSFDALRGLKHTTARERWRVTLCGMELWLKAGNTPQADARTLDRSVDTVGRLPVQHRSVFAQAFVVHAPANFQLERYSPPLVVVADEVGRASPDHMTPPAAYLLMAEMLSPQDRGLFLQTTLARSPTLMHNLSGFAEANPMVGVGYLKRAFAATSRQDSDRLMWLVRSQLDEDTIGYVNEYVGAELGRSALYPAGRAPHGKPLKYRVDLGYNA